MVDSARAVLIAWAKSEGFAAVHNGQATDEAIVDDLLAYLEQRGFILGITLKSAWFLVAEREKAFDWGALHELRKGS